MRNRFTRVKRHLRLGRPVRSHNRKINKRLPDSYKRSIMQMAQDEKEHGGSIDFHRNGEVELEAQKSHSSDQITLNPDKDDEVIWHTHPYSKGNEPLQATPSPEDILMMIKMKDDENWAVSTDKTFTVYREGAKTPKHSRGLKKELNRDYDAIQIQSYGKYPQIKNAKKRDKAQTRWMSRKWLELLRGKYKIHIKQHKRRDKVNLSLKKIKG